MLTSYTKMDSLEQREFITRIINCLCCSEASYQSFNEVLEREEVKCRSEGNLALINPQNEKE